MNGVTVYSKNKSGKTLEWRAESDLQVNSDGYIPINVYYGQQGGKIQHKVRYTKSGKNLGKANATTIEEQALLDISYLYRAQLEEKGYFKSIDDYKKPRVAMLAHKFQDKKHTLAMDENEVFSHVYYAQPKLNGIRCTATKVDECTIEFVSRTNKLFTSFTHLTSQLLPLLEVGDTVDGELFNPKMPLEHIVSLVNSDTDRYVVDKTLGVTLWNITDIEYHLYDAIPNNKDHYTFKERSEWLSNLFENPSTSLVNTLTKEVKSLDEVRSLFSEWLEQGYEGLMLRDSEGTYDFNERSVSLLKYKEMLDEEFQIVDIIESPNEPGQPVFIVDLRNDDTCKVRKSGIKADNEKYLTDSSSFIGKWLTVQYQARTKYDNLSFPIGLEIRAGTFKDNVFIPDV